MIRQKFRWQTESPVPAEWFDLDREENMTDFDPDTQPLTPVPDDEYDETKFCPYCRSPNPHHLKDFEKDGIKYEAAYFCEKCTLRWDANAQVGIER